MTAKAAKTPRPRREKKADRLTHPGKSAAEIQCDFALAPFDRVAIEMERKWGVDRLPELVAPEMAAKYGSAMSKLNQAIEANDVEQVVLRASVCIRGLQAMDRAAEEAGAKPAPADVWLFQADGREYAVLRDDAAWPSVLQDRPGCVVLTEREVVMAVERFVQTRLGETVVAVKQAFPGAAVSGVRKEDDDGELNGEIPW